MLVGVAQSELILHAAHGDRHALARLLELHGPTVRSLVAPRIPLAWRALVSADDVMQETYTDAFLSMEEFSPAGEGSFRCWLLKIATNNLSSALRMLRAQKRGGRRTRLEPRTREESCSALLTAIAVTWSTPSLPARRAEACDVLTRALDLLPCDHARVVSMYDLEGLPAECVAGALGRNVGAMFMLRARAHRKLRAIVGDSGAISGF